MTERTVAFIDILGFKEIVESSSASEIGARFSQIIGRTLPGMNRSIDEFPDEPTLLPGFSSSKPYCISYAFSDSVILISNDDSEESCLALLLYALRVSQVLIGCKFPVRGAITYGDMYVDLDNSLFLGKALTHAYELEQRQNWIGMIIDSSIPQKFPEILVKDEPIPGVRQKLFPKYEVPMKSGPVELFHTLNWRWNLIAPKGTKNFFNDSGNWSAKTKIDSALVYAQEMRRLGLAYPATDEIVPIEVRPIYLAEGNQPKVPPSHGDDY